MTGIANKEEKAEYKLENSPFSWDKLDGLLAFKPSLVVCSEMLGVCSATIKNHIKLRYNLTFTEYADRKLSPTRIKLVSKAIEMAEGGNVSMMIFCLKNICGWLDRPEVIINSEDLKLPSKFEFRVIEK